MQVQLTSKMICKLRKLLKCSHMGHCNFYFWDSLIKISQLLVFMNIFICNSVEHLNEKTWFRYHVPISFENAKKSVPFIFACKCVWICMQAYPESTQNVVSGYKIFS